MKRLTAVAAILTAASAFAQTPTAQPPAKPATAPRQAATPAATTTLKVGDKAPAIAVESWVKGDSVTSFEKGKFYVVEFWATWCGPCKESIPHLTQLQKDYKGKVTVIGVDIWEDSRGKKYSAETLPAVKKFVEEFGDKMNYTVAYDGPEKATDKAYMKASGMDKKGIPTAFIVDGEGKIAWIGSPFEMDGALEHIVKGDWNDATKAEVEKALKAENEATMAYGRALQTGDVAKTLDIGPKIIAKHGTSPGRMNELAWSIVDPAGKFAAKLKDEPKLLALAADAANHANQAAGGKDGAILDTLARVYWVKGEKDKAIETQKKAVELAEPSMKGEIEATLREYMASGGGN